MPPPGRLEDIRADVGQRNVSDLIENNQFVLLPSHHQPADLVVLLGFDQFVDQRGCGGETDAPLLPAGGQAQSGGEVSLSSAAVADQYERFLSIDIAAFGQLADAGR